MQQLRQKFYVLFSVLCTRRCHYPEKSLTFTKADMFILYTVEPKTLRFEFQGYCGSILPISPTQDEIGSCAAPEPQRVWRLRSKLLQLVKYKTPAEMGFVYTRRCFTDVERTKDSSKVDHEDDAARPCCRECALCGQSVPPAPAKSVEFSSRSPRNLCKLSCATNKSLIRAAHTTQTNGLFISDCEHKAPRL